MQKRKYGIQCGQFQLHDDSRSSTIVEATKGWDVNQINTMTMLWYNCRQFGHWSDRCRNARNFDLVAHTLKAQGCKPCENVANLDIWQRHAGAC
jgi:hypothetical protein